MVKIVLLIGFINALLIANVSGKHVDSEARDDVYLRERQTKEYQSLPVIAGDAAQKGFYSHQVSFVDGDGRHYCGGSLIANNVVLGAAHCVEDADNVIKNHRVHVNKYYYRNSDNPDMEVLKICDINVHHNYVNQANIKRKKGVLHDYDFALYKLCKDSHLAKKGKVVPIKLNRKKKLPKYQQVLTLTGFGLIQKSPPIHPNELQAVKVKYFDNDSCTTSPFKYSKEQITKSMMCAGVVGGGRGSCNGDSGGPLVIRGKNKKKHVLVGVVSWSSKPREICSDEGYPNVYGRVSYVVDWIKEKACPWIKGSCTIRTN